MNLRKLTKTFVVHEFWANKNITFELEKGDMLGIVGSNGAGKSTLLKAISGIMVPTKGRIQVQGNIAALLELTSGFDGDLTVRENTYLRGALPKSLILPSCMIFRTAPSSSCPAA